MIRLSKEQSELSGELRCEVCRGVIVSGDRFYDMSYRLKTQGGGSVLITKLYHFNCVQRGQVISPEAKDRQEKLASVIAERETAEQELEESEQRLSDLEAEESQLRRKLSEVYK